MSQPKTNQARVAKAAKQTKRVKVKVEGDKRGAENGTVHKQKKEKSLLFTNWDKSDDDDDQYLNDLKQSDFLRSKLEECYDRKVNIPEDTLQEYNQIFLDIITSLLPKLQRNTSRVRCLDPVYVGSSVDNLMVKPNIHFDVQIPICVVGRVTVEHPRPGFVTMRLPACRAKEDRWAGWRSPDNYLSPVLANHMMYKFVLQWMSMRELPGVTVDDYEPGRVICVRIGDSVTIDITPMIDLKRKEDPYPYLAKPFRYEREPESEYLWRISCFEREKELLQIIEKADGGYRCKALKIMKALRHEDAALEHLTTYHMKTVLLHMCDGQVDKFRWQKHKIDSCFMSLLEEILETVRNRHLRHFVLTDIDIFDNIPEHIMVTIGNRLKILCAREKELGRLLDK